MAAGRRERSGMPRAVTALLVAMSALLLLPSARAEAGAVPVSVAPTTIELSPALMRALHQDGVKVSALAPATSTGAAFTLPCGGSVEVTSGEAVIECSGGLAFRRGRQTVRVTDLQSDSATGSVEGDVGYGEMPLATAGFVASPEGFGVRIGSAGLHLTRPASRALRTGLRLPLRNRHGRVKGGGRRRQDEKKRTGPNSLTPAFRPGQLLGVLSGTAQPGTVGISPGGSLTLGLDPGLAARLTDVGVRFSVGSGAGEPGHDSFLFGVGGGSFDLMSQALDVQGGGFLRLRQILPAGEGDVVDSEVTLADPSLDLGAGTLAAEMTGRSATSGNAGVPTGLNFGFVGLVGFAGLPVPAGALVVEPGARTIGLQGAPVTLSSESAEMLDGFRRLYEEMTEEERPQDQIRSGEALGTVQFSVQAE